jgi:hypothetical protein
MATSIRLGLMVATLALAALAHGTPVAAQYYGYPAYGAWRGKARTVITPRRTSSKVRWGSGITPAGAAMFTTILTDPNFLGTVGSIVGRSDEVLYVTEEEFESIRRTLNERRAMERSATEQRSAERERSHEQMQAILAEHREMIDRLGSSPLESRTQRLLSDAKEIYQSGGTSPKLQPTREEGERLQGKYGEIRDAIQKTNEALDALIEARKGS